MPPLNETEAIKLFIAGTITALTLGTAFGLLALGFEFFWIIFPLGFGVVLPTALGFVGLHHATTGSHEKGSGQDEFDTARNKLQQQYVHGELSDEVFERRLERLMANARGETASINY